MRQSDFYKRIVSVLRVSGNKKRLKKDKHEFTISDSRGNSKKFTIGFPVQEVAYNEDDITKIITAACEVIKGAMRTGDRITISGFGTLSVAYRHEGVARNPRTGELCIVKAKYRPKFKAASGLKKACEDYEDHLKEIQGQDDPTITTYDDDEFYFEEEEDVLSLDVLKGDGADDSDELSIEVDLDDPEETPVSEEDDFEDPDYGDAEDLDGFEDEDGIFFVEEDE